MFYVYRNPEKSGIVCIEADSTKEAEEIANNNALTKYRLTAGVNVAADQLLKMDWVINYTHEIKVIRKKSSSKTCLNERQEAIQTAAMARFQLWRLQ